MPLEPALGAHEPLRAQVQQASALLDERPASVQPDRPAGDRADQVPERPGTATMRHVRRSRARSRVPKSTTCCDANAPEATRARVDHHELARGREDGVDRHQHEDG
jgi:hypothetical protein